MMSVWVYIIRRYLILLIYYRTSFTTEVHAQAARDVISMDSTTVNPLDSAGGCGVPQRVQFAEPEDEFLNVDFDVPGQTVYYKCSLGYSRVPRLQNFITCLKDGTWSNLNTFCKIRSCGNPGEPDNGYMDYTEFTFGSRVTYHCDKGFSMKNSRNYRDCRADGSWSNMVPVCEAQVCSSPPMLINGQFNPEKDEYVYLDSVTYSCNKDLALIGENSISCKEDGKWSANAPECREVQCISPNVRNAARLSGFSGPYYLNSAITFKCFTGYEMKGSMIIICNKHSIWEPEPPKCLGICKTLPYIRFAELEEPTKDKHFLEGTTLRLRCKEGYEPVSGAKSNVTCLGKTWEQIGHICTPISCGDPGPISNGTMQGSSFRFPSYATYACIKGFKIKGVNSRRCQANGSWSLPIPECEVQTCPQPKNTAGLEYSPIQQQYHYGDKVSFTCHKGYQLSGHSTSGCNDQGIWSPIQPFCKVQTCPQPKNTAGLEYSPMQQQYHYGDKVSFTCHKGYKLSGHSTSGCNDQGIWSPNQPFCKEICHAPPKIENAQLKNVHNDVTTFFKGQNVFYECHPGYVFSAPYKTMPNVTCLGQIQWSKPEIYCTRVSCGHPREIKNAELSVKDYLFESEAFYSCKKGYQMVSTISSIKCLFNGIWSTPLPKCEVQTCPPPEFLKDGSYSIKKEKYIYQDSVTYTCNNLTVIGEASVSCTAEGNWTSGAPVCKAVCKSPPILYYGQLEKEYDKLYFDIDESVKYKCRPGFVIKEGKKCTVTCLDNNKWSEPEEFCKRLSCSHPGDIGNGKMEHTGFLFESRVNYTCNPGYTMISTKNYRECQATGNWSGDPPVCKESICDKIWELQEEVRMCTSTPDEWLKYLQVHYLYLQIENLKLEIQIKKNHLNSVG